MNRLAMVLREQQIASTKLDAIVIANLKALGYGR
jgi:hypothetical protein